MRDNFSKIRQLSETRTIALPVLSSTQLRSHENSNFLSVLLNDRSINISSERLNQLKEELASKPIIEKLIHPEVRYEVTNFCNATCIMCPRDKHNRLQGVMPQDDYEKSVDEVSALGAEKVVLTGFGEPLLDKKLEKKVAYLTRKGISSYFITNASGLTKTRAQRLLDAELDELRISFYGMTPKSYNLIMKGLDFARTKQKVADFIELRNKHSHKTKIQISYLEMDENRDETDSFVEYWESLVDAIEVWRPHNFGDGRDYRERSNDYNLIEKETCGRPENGPLQIQWNGEIVPCCYDYNNAIVLGNAFQDNVLQILNSFKYRLLRYAHELGHFSIFPYCNQCDQLLPRSDALVYTNRHNLPPEDAVKLSNTDLYDLSRGISIDDASLSEKYSQK